MCRITTPDLEPFQPLFQRVTKTVFAGLKGPEHKANYLKPCAEFKNSWSSTSTPPFVFTPGCFIKRKENFVFLNSENSVALVRERTIPTERPPPVGEVSANFCG